MCVCDMLYGLSILSLLYCLLCCGASDEESGSEGEGGSPDDVTLSTTACDVVAGCHRLPDAATLDHERRLQRIATTGGEATPAR